MKQKTFGTKKAAQMACEECMDFGYPAGVVKTGTSKWGVEAHRWEAHPAQKILVKMFLGTDGKMHDAITKVRTEAGWETL